MRFRSDHYVTRVTLLSFLVAVLAAVSFAQRLPELEVFGGYSYLRVDSPSFGFSDYTNLSGWNAAITAPHLYEQLGLTVNASGNYGPGLKVYNFLLGPQITFEKGPIQFYANLLFGKAETKIAVKEVGRNEATSVGRGVALGGGVEINVTRRFAVKLLDADYIYAKTFGVSQPNIRISTGLVYRFGKK
jgi:hypothetical protein